MCYVPKHSTTRNYTITPCTAGYYTKYTRYHVGLLRHIRDHDQVPRYIRYNGVLRTDTRYTAKLHHCAMHGGILHKVTRYHVGLLRYIRYHEVVPRYIRYKRCVTYPHTVQREITPLRTARCGITQITRDTTSDYSGTYDTNGVLRTDTQYNAKLPRRTPQVHTVPRCSTEVHTVQTVPRYIRCVTTYPHTVKREITPLRTARRGITQSTRGTTSDYSGI